MISKYVSAASSFAGDIDGLVWLILLTTGFWFILAEVVLFGLMLRYARRDGVKAMYISGEDPKEKRWVTFPHYATLAFDIMIIVAAIRVWTDVKMTMPQADETVRVVAMQWAWVMTQPGPDGKLDTADDIRTVDELNVERGKTYHFELGSRDVVHSFSIPVFRLKQDAIPGRVIKGWFRPTLAGGFDIQCTEICGIGHAIMPARLIVRDPEEHRRWLASHATATAATPTIDDSAGGMP